MKKNMYIVALMVAVVLAGCGGTGNSASNQTATTPPTQQSAGASILGSLLGGAASGSTESLLTGVIGALVDGAKSASIVGTWVYQEPSVEFESANLLAQAGGAVAANQIVSKIKPYYEMIGISAGKLSITFKEDKTCEINADGNVYPATYEYDPSAHTLKVTGQNFGISLGTAYATVSSTQMSLTLDSSRLLGIAQTLGAASGNTTLSTLSTLSSSLSGMKTGFKFQRK